jgi:hypothetical protein
MDEENKKIDENSKSSLAADGQGKTDWQLPSLNFRPLSFLHYSQVTSERPRSSGPLARSNPPTIISPTPKRPMSSQSRRRFSKILGMDDNSCPPPDRPANLSRSFNSLNSGKLKRVLETSETRYPPRYSIPPFSPRNSMITESTRDNESMQGSTDQEHGSGCEKSTVESLLDKHIECLGLQAETESARADDQKIPEDDGTQASTISTSRDERTIRIKLEPAPKRRVRSQTLSLADASRADSHAKQALVPKGLFSPKALERPRLGAALSSPCVSQLAFQNLPSRPSLGWDTLASTSNLSVADRDVREPLRRSTQPTEANAIGKREAKQLSNTRLSPSTSSRWSRDSKELYDWNDDMSIRQRSRERALTRQISQRRRMRARLKLKRNSRSHGRIYGSELSSNHGSFHTARVPSQDRVSVQESLCKRKAPSLDSQEEGNTVTVAADTARGATTEQRPGSDPPPISPKLPNRRSSVVAVATQRVKHNIDMARKISVRTIRSHHSNASVVEPMNSTRLSALAPHIGPPDLGPPLTSVSLNMDFAFPPASTPAAPGLKATQSFFSDDSSAVQNPRASIRKRFNMPSLRSVLPSSPRAQPIANGAEDATEASRARLHHSCQMQGLRQEGAEHDLHGTEGMSEFAYCRRRMLERVKGWWRRQNLQRRLRLKSRKPACDSSHGGH